MRTLQIGILFIFVGIFVLCLGISYPIARGLSFKEYCIDHVIQAKNEDDISNKVICLDRAIAFVEQDGTSGQVSAWFKELLKCREDLKRAPEPEKVSEINERLSVIPFGVSLPFHWGIHILIPFIGLGTIIFGGFLCSQRIPDNELSI